MAATTDGCTSAAPVLGQKLAIVDEFGYLSFGRDGANLFFNVVAKRYERGSMILTSNLSFAVAAALGRRSDADRGAA